MKFKIMHPESDCEWVEEFENEEAAYERYGDGICSIQKLEEDDILHKRAEEIRLRLNQLQNKAEQITLEKGEQLKRISIEAGMLNEELKKITEAMENEKTNNLSN